MALIMILVALGGLGMTLAFRREARVKWPNELMGEMKPDYCVLDTTDSYLHYKYVFELPKESVTATLERLQANAKALGWQRAVDFDVPYYVSPDRRWILHVPVKQSAGEGLFPHNFPISKAPAVVMLELMHEHRDQDILLKPWDWW